VQHLEVSCAVRRLFKSFGFKGLKVKLSGHVTRQNWLIFSVYKVSLYVKVGMWCAVSATRII